MFRYQDIQGRPAVFRGLTGMDLQAFETLFTDFETARQAGRAASACTRRDGRPRRRAPGAGRRYALDPRDRLLMALVWLRVYPTYELLGYFFGLHNGNACRNVADVLAVLEALGDFPFDRPNRDGDRAKLDSAAAVMDAFPEVRLVVDTKDQRGRRPGRRYQGSAGPPAPGRLCGAEAVLLDEEEGPHAQDATGGPPRRADRVGGRIGAGRVEA
jgi:hypothetical protein